MAARHNGTFTRSTLRQLSSSVTPPPSSGPSASATAPMP